MSFQPQTRNGQICKLAQTKIDNRTGVTFMDQSNTSNALTKIKKSWQKRYKEGVP